MQTLKTAIVVLLLMTVMYGSYVSLTTPPPTMPDAVASLIEETEDFDLGIDEGLPDDLQPLPSDDAVGASDNLASDTATVPDFNTGEPQTDASVPELSAPEFTLSDASSASESPAAEGTDNAVVGSLSDGDMKLSSADSGTKDSLAGIQLPKPNQFASGPTPDPDQEYVHSSAEAMRLPDPQSLAALPNSGWKGDAQPVSYSKPNSSSSDVPALPSEASVAPAQAEPNLGLANAIRTADRQYQSDQLLEALSTLSLFYNTPDLSSSDREALMGRLDPLAAAVIYSRRHLLEQPHRVAANETLMEIAARYQVPWQLLANINGIEDPVSVLPGTELKVVRGPFRAEIDLQKHELTLFLQDLYAGRFPIVTGSTPAPEVGTYTVQDKQTARTFYDQNGSPVPPGDAANPYGTVWIDLGKQLCIHGSPNRAQANNLGCISLSGADADDLYGILIAGSTVTIRR